VYKNTPFITSFQCLRGDFSRALGGGGSNGGDTTRGDDAVVMSQVPQVCPTLVCRANLCVLLSGIPRKSGLLNL